MWFYLENGVLGFIYYFIWVVEWFRDLMLGVVFKNVKLVILEWCLGICINKFIKWFLGS